MEPMDAQIIANYLKEKEYPESYTKEMKRRLRERSTVFCCEDQILYHCGRGPNQKKRRVVIGETEKEKVLQGIHCGEV